MPAPRIDWLTIKNRFADYDEPVLFVLPRGFQQLLLSIADRLGWQATYRINDYDFSDWETLQTLHETGVAGLLAGVPMQTLLDKIDEVVTAVYETWCCNETTAPGDDIAVNTDPDSDGWPDALPTPITDAGYTDDAEGREDYKCDAANAVVDIAANRSAAIGNVWNEYTGLAILGVLLGLLAVIATGTFAVVLAGIGAGIAATGIYGAIVDLDDGVVFDTLASDFAEHKECLAYEIVQGDGYQAGADNVRAYIDANFSSALAKQIAKLLLWEQWIAMLYAGRWGDTDFAELVAENYTGSTCECDTTCATDETTFGTSFDGLGSWTGGAALTTNHVRLNIAESDSLDLSSANWDSGAVHTPCADTLHWQVEALADTGSSADTFRLRIVDAGVTIEQFIQTGVPADSTYHIYSGELDLSSVDPAGGWIVEVLGDNNTHFIKVRHILLTIG